MEKRSGTFVLMISLLIIFLSVLTTWFTISSLKTTGFATKVPIQTNFEDKPLPGPSIFRFVNFNPSDILSGNFTLGIQVNSSNPNLKEMGLYLLHHGNLYSIKTIPLSPNKKFYAIDFDTSEFPDYACDYKFVVSFKTPNGPKYSFSKPFSILNDYIPLESSYEIKNQTFFNKGNAVLYSVKARYSGFIKNKIKINETEAYVSPDFHCFVKTPFKMIFNNITFIKPKVLINGKSCSSLCRIISYKNNTLGISSLQFGRFKIVEGFRFGIDMYTPSLAIRKYSQGQEIPFTVFLTDKYGNKRSGYGINCNASFYLGNDIIPKSMIYSESTQTYQTSLSFNKKGVFDWVTKCINLTSGYINTKGGKFRVQ